MKEEFGVAISSFPCLHFIFQPKYIWYNLIHKEARRLTCRSMSGGGEENHTAGAMSDEQFAVGPSSVSWVVKPCSLEQPNVSEEHVTSSFRMEKQEK
jgi:hypothetical protein